MPCIAPSWSWAGIQGHISYTARYGRDDHVDDTVLIEVLEATTQPPSLSISHTFTGTLKIKGILKEALAIERIEDGETAAVIPKWSDADTSQPKTLQESVHQYLRKSGPEVDVQNEEKVAATRISYSIPDVPVGGVIRTSSTDLTAHPRLVSSQSLPVDGQTYRMDERDLKEALATKLDDTDGIHRMEESYMNTPIAGAHFLVEPNAFKRVGGWAPDVLAQQRLSKVFFLGVSRGQKSVCCLGLVEVEGRSGEYRRTGLGYWDLASWDAAAVLSDGVLEIV